VIGANIGKNKDTPNERAAQDYEQCMEVLYPLVDYVSINISSPNTPGLRELQSAQLVAALLERLLKKRELLRQKHGRHVALALKVSPDLDEGAIRGIAEAVRRPRIDGLIVGNTTVSRDGVDGLRHAHEEGGLSGEPLRRRASDTLRKFAFELKGEVPLIGCGGIMSAADAQERFRAGASLVQLYTGLVYRGPRLIGESVAAHEA
jgi:dihydroorotate dehydrogenase